MAYQSEGETAYDPREREKEIAWDADRHLRGGGAIGGMLSQAQAMRVRDANLKTPGPIVPFGEYSIRAEKALASLNHSIEVLRERLEPVLRSPIPENAAKMAGDIEPAPPSGICSALHEMECRARSTERIVQDILNRITV